MWAVQTFTHTCTCTRMLHMYMHVCGRPYNIICFGIVDLCRSFRFLDLSHSLRCFINVGNLTEAIVLNACVSNSQMCLEYDLKRMVYHAAL